MFLPVINVNGGTPVDWWGVARAAISTRGSLISQYFWLVATYFFNMLITVLLARSTWTEEIGWWLIWSLACIPRSLHTYCMISAVKWGTRSELLWFINRQAVISAVSLGAGRHSIHFVNSQTTWGSICYPVLTVAGVLPSLFGGPTMGRSFLSFAVVHGGLDLPVGTGNTPGIL